MTTYYVVDGRRNPMTEEAIELMNESQAPGAIPGCTKMDIYHGTVGMNQGGHSIHDQNDERLHDPTLHARVAYWLRPKAFSSF